MAKSLLSQSATWIVYGLLENRDDDHDLRFIGVSERPQEIADAHPEYEACMAFPAAAQLWLAGAQRG